MAQTNNKICVQLTFNKAASYGQRIKVKDFWKFLDDTKPLEPYEVKVDKKVSKEEKQESPSCKRKWYYQLRVFQENGLDRVATAAGKECKPCRNHSTYTSSDCPDTIKESYDELLNDMKTFDKRADDKIHDKLAQKRRSSRSRTDYSQSRLIQQ